MEKEEDMHEDLKGLSFRQTPKQNFPIPPDYFDLLPDRIMDRWELERSIVPEKRIILWQMFASAAMVTGICLGIVWFTNESLQSQATSDITSTEAYQYIMENIQEFAPLMHETGQWPEGVNPELPSATGIEEYLIEELDGDQLETIF